LPCDKAKTHGNFVDGAWESTTWPYMDGWFVNCSDQVIPGHNIDWLIANLEA
jgi:hypothetical protein